MSSKKQNPRDIVPILKLLTKITRSEKIYTYKDEERLLLVLGLLHKEETGTAKQASSLFLYWCEIRSDAFFIEKQMNNLRQNYTKKNSYSYNGATFYKTDLFKKKLPEYQALEEQLLAKETELEEIKVEIEKLANAREASK